MQTALLAAAVALAAAPSTSAAPLVLTLKNHRFTPAAITVPAGQRVEIQLINLDAAVEEFDSKDLGGIEEDVTPHGRTSFSIGPLKPGVYSFMGEFHADTAEGRVVAR